MLPPAYSAYMDDQSKYRTTARPWADGWELHVEGTGVTQVRDLRDARRQARDFIETMTGQGIPLDAVELDVSHP